MSYSPPVVTNGVYFTKALTSDNYNYGTNVIAEWSRKSPIVALHLGASYQGYLDYLEQNYPTYIEYLGTLVGQFGTTPMFQVADSVAGNGKLTYPTPSDWANVVTSQLGAEPSTLSIVASGVSDAASSVVNGIETAGETLLIVVVIVAIFLGVLIYQGKVKIPVIG